MYYYSLHEFVELLITALEVLLEFPPYFPTEVTNSINAPEIGFVSEVYRVENAI